MSYFVGHKAVKDGHKEDAGFAINGGKGWADVVFDNHQIEVNGNSAIAMGNYYFTSCADGSKTKVEYTFGYKKNADGNVRIFLHHSSASWLRFRILLVCRYCHKTGFQMQRGFPRKCELKVYSSCGSLQQRPRCLSRPPWLSRKLNRRPGPAP